MSATQNMLEILKSGQFVGTDNATCRKIGTNQVPDVARKLRNQGYKIDSNFRTILKHSKKVRVVYYAMSNAEIKRINGE